MKDKPEQQEIQKNLHESRWARVRWGHHLVSNGGGKIGYACERCVFDAGEHAPFCHKSLLTTIHIAHGDSNKMTGL